jgi:alpha-glucosidase (family GH31 glycosyl hydrolase)
MPPYWALGFQISRYGYENLDDMKEVLKRFQDNNIPLVIISINKIIILFFNKFNIFYNYKINNYLIFKGYTSS